MAPAPPARSMSPFLQNLFLFYFLTHIPITLLIDSQAIFTAGTTSFHPQFAQDLLKWYTTEYNDILMKNPPAWFHSIVCAELFLQLPFFFVAVYAFFLRLNWIRLPCIVYGSHVATTMIPILDAFARAKELSSEQRTLLCCVYMPYLIVPLLVVMVMCKYEKPFGLGALPRGHPTTAGGDVSKCPFASLMGMSGNGEGGGKKEN